MAVDPGFAVCWGSMLHRIDRMTRIHHFAEMACGCGPGALESATIASGRADMRPDAGDEALRQLVLRYAGALWLDTTEQSSEQTVEAIVSDLDASRVVCFPSKS